MIRTALAPLRRLARDNSGLALVEFALVLPIALTLYMAGYQISDAIACNRKVTITARATADLTSQYSILTTNDVMTILAASTKVMAPYDASNALVRVSEITTDGGGNTKVTWSKAINGAALVAGSTATLPTQLKYNNSSLIYAEVVYSYKPVASFGFVSPKTLTQNIYMVPRTSDDVNCTDCNS